MITRTIKSRFNLLLLAGLYLPTVLSETICLAADFMVSSAAQINTAMSSAQPGDTLTMTNGTWTNQQISFAGFGNSTNPITLRAQTPGQVILNGNSTVNISGSWLTVDGLNFDGGALSASDHVVEFRGSFGEATNSRFTNSAIINYNPPSVDTRYFWVSLYGNNNRVDHNRFEGQDHSGVTVTVWRDNADTDDHLIDSNHFVDRPKPNNPSDANGFETIRIGDSSQSLSSSYTTVENNLFERLDGEIEIISNKSGHNTYRYNTFRESAGTLTLRHGNDNLVEGNFFLGNDKNESGAIRVIGERQTIVNNYIANVDDRAGGAISISAGVQDSPLNGYFQVKDAVIAHNTLVNTSGVMLKFDDGIGSSSRTLRAENVTVANNIFRSDGPTIFSGTEGANWTWEGNIAHGGGLGPKNSNQTGISTANPQLQQDSNGLWRLSANSIPAIDMGVGSYSGLFNDDMDGQARIGLFDIGADEFSAAQIVRKPLAAGDVGPGWLGPVDPPGGAGGCFARGCAIQAEDYASILDPNGDSMVWTTVADTEALAGMAIVAPGGDNRIDLPGETHDSIAVYNMSFSQAGTYRAYYRAKGSNGSSDSLYVPSDFDIDPIVNEGTTSSGAYVWETGGLFTIGESNVDVPLEFRIGKREEMNRLDALVLDLDQSLSPEELDALFDQMFAAGDFNEDGYVDGNDLLAWQTGYGTPGSASHLDGDADEDGDVDGQDFLAWQRGYTGSAPLLASQAVAVPECSGMTLCLIGLLVSAVGARSKSSLRPNIRSSFNHA